MPSTKKTLFCKSCKKPGHNRVNSKLCSLNPINQKRRKNLSSPTLPTTAAAVSVLAPAQAPEYDDLPLAQDQDPIDEAIDEASVPAPRIFGTGKAASSPQQKTVYKTLGRMNVLCSHCSALHWIEVNNFRCLAKIQVDVYLTLPHTNHHTVLRNKQ
jgi:hypothetical protein